MSFAAVQKHVAVLERAGLVTQERRGREQLDQLETAWRGRVDRMSALMAQTNEHHQHRQGLRQPDPHPGRVFADQDGTPVDDTPISTQHMRLTEHDGRDTAEGSQQGVGQMDALLAE
jgi:hypothetical protein